MDKQSKSFPGNIDQLYQVLSFVSAFAQDMGFNPKIIKEIELSVEEAFVNIIKHAYVAKEAAVKVELEQKGKMFEITFIDHGPAFDPLEHLDQHQTSQELLENIQIGGVGIVLIHAYMDDLVYKREGSCNVFTLKKKLPN